MDFFGCLFDFFFVCSLFFLYVPFILLQVRFLVSFQCFLRFGGLFLPIRYTFCYIPCSFADFTCFFNFTLVSLHFAIMSCNFESFLSIGYMLVSFRYISCRLYIYIYIHLILPHFGFTLLVCCSVRDDKQGGKPDSQISALHFEQLFPQWFTMFTSFLDMSISFLKIDLQ